MCSNSQFTDGLKRILRDNPALPPARTRELAVAFHVAQEEVCRQLAELTYPLERVALELKAGSLPYFREGSDTDHKRHAGKKSSYRFAGFAPSHMAEFEARLGDLRSSGPAAEEFIAWQAQFLLRFTFEVIEQVALRVSPPPGLVAGEPNTRRLRNRLAEAIGAARGLRDQMLAGNLLLAAEIALRRGRFYPTFVMDELFAAGSDGLLIAINRYDATVGQFSTYAMPWIKMAIDRHVAKNRHVIRIPIGMQDKARRERKRAEGSPGTPCATMLLIPEVQSLEESLPGLSEAGLRLEDVVADPAATRPADAVERADIAQILGEGMRKLDRLKQFVIAMRSDIGDAAELGASMFREEAALSLARGRATSLAASRATEEPARIRLISGPVPAAEVPEEAEETRTELAFAV